MGATFGALHVKGASVARAVAWVDEELATRGLSRVHDAEPETTSERRVLVFEDRGWVVIADEDQLSDTEATLARSASERLDADVLAIGVFHSDTAILRRFRKGESVGSFEVPDGSVTDATTGHRRVDTRFLADLGVASEAKRELEAGLLADYTFAEKTLYRLAELVGLPHPSAGATYLWSDPPPNAKKLRFVPSVAAVAASLLRDVPHLPRAQAIILSAHPSHKSCVGMPLDEHVTFTANASGGARVSGIVVELRGSAIDHLEIPAIAGWNPDIAPGRSTEILVVPVERRDGVMVARFPSSFIAPSAAPVMTAYSAAAMRAWTEALHAQSKNQFVFSLRGRARVAGVAELFVRLTDLEGLSLDANEARVDFDVAPAPRAPILPASAKTATEPHAARRLLDAGQNYAGRAWLSGWIGFDAPWAALASLVLESATALGRFLARARGPLEISITSAATHPTVPGRFDETRALGDARLVLDHLANEADVRLHVPYDVVLGRGPDPGYVRLRHQPNGTTVFDAQTRRALPAQPRIVPVDLFFSLPRPDDEATRIALGEIVARLFTEGAARSTCAGGWAGPTGEAVVDEATPYEELAGLRSNGAVVDTLRERPRSPGWRAIAPRGVASLVASEPVVLRTETEAGLLLAIDRRDPFAMTDAERASIERALLPAFR